MKLLLCIDDTDNLDSIGTGEVLENLCMALEENGLAKGGFVTRHQLFIHEDIAYTSHNSSMCCQLQGEDAEQIVEFCRNFMAGNCAEGSDPGLCVFCLDAEAAKPTLEDFGKRAKVQVLTKAQAYETAETFPGVLWLSEHGGTGDGIIGALAGIGLRLTGMDGRIKGKIIPETEGERMTVGAFCQKYGMQQVTTEAGERIAEDQLLCFKKMTKGVFRDGKATVLASFEEDAWVPKPKDKKGRGR